MGIAPPLCDVSIRNLVAQLRAQPRDNARARANTHAVIAFAGLAAVVLAGACHQSSASGADSGTPSSDGSSTDQTVTCTSAGTICQDRAVYSCPDGGVGDFLRFCDTECSPGGASECVPQNCENAARLDPSSGCKFYGLRPDNIDSDVDTEMMLLLSSASESTADVLVEARTADGSWTPILDGVRVPPNTGVRVPLSLPPAVRNAGVTAAGGFRVISNQPIRIVQLLSDDVNHGSHSSAGTALLPFQSLGMSYLAVTYPQTPSDNVLKTPGALGGAAAIAVVAASPNVNVRITPSADAVVDRDGKRLRAHEMSAPVNMAEGDVLQIFSAVDGGDLTGTRIDADGNGAIAVFSGNVYSTYGARVTGFNGGDLMFEQLPPVSSWGSAYVGAAWSGQTNCDSFWGEQTSHWTVVAAQDGTAVHLVLPAGFGVDGSPKQFSLNQGESRSFSVRPDTASSTPPTPGRPDVIVEATYTEAKILLAQWLDCEPALAWGINSRMGHGTMNFVLPPGFDHELIVVRKQNTSVSLNGQSDLGAPYAPLGDFEIARVPASRWQPCDDSLDVCNHRLDGSDFSTSLRGMDVVCSYAVTPPPHNERCALPTVSCPN